MKTLTNEEFQAKVATLKSPDDLMAFLKDIAAPETGIAEERTEPLPAKPKKYRRLRISGPAMQKRYDMAENETDEIILSLYAKGLTTRDIVNYLKDVHQIEMSQSSISAVTDKAYPHMKEWQTRALSSTYAFLYLDGLHFKVRDAGKIVSKCAYIALGVNEEGYKEVLGIWVGESESAKFWMQILNELKNRGVEDILIACIDGLRGFVEAINAIYPEAQIQHCIVHQVRHTVKFLPHKDREDFCESLKTVYGAPTEEAGRDALEKVKARWPKYQICLKSWEDKWAELAPFFEYPEPIRRAIYTTNAIENLNRQFRKVTKTTTIFPHDESLLKLLWLAQDDITKKWSFPVRNWGEILTQLAILFPEKIAL
jgi:putative transposase